MTDDGQLSFDDVAARAYARTTDPLTSHQAAASISEDDLRASQRAVLEFFRALGPMSDEDFVREYPRYVVPPWPPRQSPSGLRTRRHELHVAGFIEDSGERVTLPSGRQATVWKAAS